MYSRQLEFKRGTLKQLKCKIVLTCISSRENVRLVDHSSKGMWEPLAIFEGYKRETHDGLIHVIIMRPTTIRHKMINN